VSPVETAARLTPLFAGLTLAVAIPAGLTWGFGFVIRRWAPAWGLVDQPDARKDHARTIPLGGGLAMLAAVGSTLGAASLTNVLPANLQAWVWGSFLAAALVGGLGLLDDFRDCDWRIRLSGQFLVASGWVLGCGPASVAGSGNAVMICATIFWLVGLTNAINFLDNMDGLAAGVVFLAAGALALGIGLGPAETEAPARAAAAFSLACLAGAALGFWAHNRSPARLFMGDAGSYFLGFSLAAGAAQLGGEGMFFLGLFHDQGISLGNWLAPWCALAVPLYDAATVITLRLSQGRSPFHADRQHVSHRLAARGWTRVQAVRALHALGFLSGSAALALTQTRSWPAAVGIAAAVVGLWLTVLVWEFLRPVSALRRAGDDNPRR